MTNINYYEIYKNSKDSFFIRLKIIESVKNIGIKPTARKYNTTKTTVKKWINRFNVGGKKAIKDRSKRPNNSPNQMLAYWQFKILEECKRLSDNNKRIRATRIKNKLQVPYSVTVILKQIKKNGYLRIKNTKKKRIKDLREIKQKYKAFEKIQVDIKELQDIPEFFHHLIDFKLPKYQFTARCVKTGAMFISYGYEKTCTNSTIFIIKILKHLKKYGIKLKDNIIQTDNGTEFSSGWQSIKKSGFTKVIEDHNKMIHMFIPPGISTYNSDVETAHRLIEEEFYAYEIIESYDDFFNKAWIYSKHFNYSRNNCYKGASPYKILKNNEVPINSGILNFKPIVLDNHLDFYQKYFLKYNLNVKN